MYSASLRGKIDLLRPRLRDAGRAHWAHPRFERIYPEYLYTIHTVIRASVPLMQASLACAQQRTGEPLCTALAGYLAGHIPEELHHDDWVLEDLEVLGYARQDVLSRIPSATVAALAGAQYYWIHHVHPVAVLGYIAALEGDPPAAEDVELMIARTGLPRAAFRTVHKHAVLDPRHREDLDRFLDSLPLGPFHESLIGTSALHTVHLLAEAMEQIRPAAVSAHAGSAV